MPSPSSPAAERMRLYRKRRLDGGTWARASVTTQKQSKLPCWACSIRRWTKCGMVSCTVSSANKARPFCVTEKGGPGRQLRVTGEGVRAALSAIRTNRYV